MNLASTVSETLNARRRVRRPASPLKFAENSYGRRFRDTWFNEVHVPSIGIALIDRDDAAMHFMRPATREGDCDRELGKAITTVALDMHFHDFNRMAAGAGGKALRVIDPEGFPTTHDRARR
jgi:hypothetical protein